MKNGVYFTGTWNDGTGNFTIATFCEDFPSRTDRTNWFPNHATNLRWELWKRDCLVDTQSCDTFHTIPKETRALAGNSILVFTT